MKTLNHKYDYVYDWSIITNKDEDDNKKEETENQPDNNNTDFSDYDTDDDKRYIHQTYSSTSTTSFQQ